MLTKNGKLLVGGEIKQWLTSLMPCELSNFSFQGRGGGFGSSLDDDDDCERAPALRSLGVWDNPEDKR